MVNAIYHIPTVLFSLRWKRYLRVIRVKSGGQECLSKDDKFSGPEQRNRYIMEKPDIERREKIRK